MAVVFELVVTFDEGETAAKAVVPDHVRVGDRVFPLHPPFRHGRELAVMPVGVSWGLPMDRDLPRTPLSKGELTALGHALYDVLRTMHDYEAAMVGWDPEPFVDLAELAAEWPDAPDGLVLSTAARRALPPRPGFEPFTSDHDWLPYKGER